MTSTPLPGFLLRRVWACITIFATFFIAGCAYSTRAPAAFDSESAHWQGRISVKVGSAPPQSVAAQFELSGSATAGQMDLSTPLGTTVAQMRWSAESAELLASGETRVYPNLAGLTVATLGAELPVNALFQWLQGQPTTAPGWQVNLTDWEQGRISAQRTVPSPTVDLKIILDR